MKTDILLIGAGKSSAVLIDYLNQLTEEFEWKIVVVSKEKMHSIAENVLFFEADVFNDDRINDWILNTNLVISMLPATLHFPIAQKCLEYKKHFISASYVSEEMKSLDQQVKESGLVFLNECGLDPGLDHLSAMKIIDEIKSKGGVVKGFESFTGGLIAPKSDNNPWHYKLTWNPKNVVLAGQGGVAKFKQKGTYKYIPYQQLFKRTELISITGYGRFEGYANRDSLKYGDLYGLEGVETLFRGTLRQMGFCKAWNKLIQLGMTDDSYIIHDLQGLRYRDFTNLFLAYHPTDSVEVKFQRVLGIEQDDFSIIEKMDYLGLFSNDKIPLKSGTPAEVLQELLERKWKLEKEDKDMIVMWHKFNYDYEGQSHEMQSSLVVEGESQSKTAMAKTVGLPLGIIAKLILIGNIKSKGVLIPILPEIYLPVLKELSEKYQITFQEVKIN